MIAALLSRKTLVASVVFVAAVVLYPMLFEGRYMLGIGITAGVMAASSVGLVLLLGYAHQLAIGQAAFCMIGGYANALLCTQYGWDPLLAMIAGALVAMATAYVIAIPVFKLRGFVLAMASLAVHLILVVVAVEMPFTGGALGVFGLPKFALLGLPLDTDLAFYFFVWVVVALTVATGVNIANSKIGRGLKAIAVSEMAAGSVGVDIVKYKAQMFVISAGMASLAGSLTVHYLRAMDPTVFGFAYSLNLITAVIVGGLTTIWGGAVGAAAIVALREILRDLSLPLWESVIMGSLTVLVLIVFRQGIAGLAGTLFDRFTGRDGGRTRVVLQAFDPTALAPFAPEAGGSGPLLRVEGVRKAFGSLKAVENVSFDLPPSSITTLIGPNGAGKTTMFNLISGSLPLDSGTVVLRGKHLENLTMTQIADCGVGRTFQHLQLFDNMSVLENVMCGSHRLSTSGIVATCLRTAKVRREEREAVQLARDCLRFVGLSGAENMTPSALPFGHQRLVEVARALALKPVLLLMDEPASGLNDTETESLANLILRVAALGVTILLVEHDMRLVMGLADQIVVMHHGQMIAQGPVDDVRKDAAVVAAYLGSAVDEPVA